MAELGREGILVHRSGIIEAANHAVARIFGYESSLLPGMAVADLFELPAVSDSYNLTDPLETTGRNANGQVVHLEIIPFPLEDDHSAILCLDITARKNAQSKISTSETLLSLIFNHTHDVMGLLELRDGIWYLKKINQNVSRYAVVFGQGWDQQALEGLPLKEYLSSYFHLDEAGISDYYKLIDKAIATEAPLEHTDETPYGNGQVIIEESTMTPIIDASGTRYLLLVSKDITQRKLAERALEESNRRYQQLMGNLPGAVFQCHFDAHWTLVFISAGIEQVTGYPAEDFMPPNNPVSYNALIAPFDEERLKQEVENAILAGNSYSLDYRITHKSGEERWVRERGNGVYNAAGQPTMIEGFIFDITDKMVAEQRVLTSILETETRERSRIAKELHDSLVQNLTSSSLTLGSLVNNALAAADRDRFDRGLALLKNAIMECREISHNLMPKSIEEFGLAVAIRSTLEDLNRAATCHFELIENIEEMELDNRVALTLFRVVQESLNNILKHSRATNATIQLLRFGNTLQLIVEDNGQGFDPAAEQGTSFGLDSIRSRAKSLGAQLFIESNPQSGTSIHLELDLWTP